MDNDIMNASLTGALDAIGINGSGDWKPGASGGELQSIGNGIYKVTMPDGDTLYVDGAGKIIG